MCMFCCSQKHPVVLGGFEPAVYVRDSEFWVEFYPVTLIRHCMGPSKGNFIKRCTPREGTQEDSKDGSKGDGFLWCFTLALRQYGSSRENLEGLKCPPFLQGVYMCV